MLKEACGYTYMTLSKDVIMLVNRPVVAGAASRRTQMTSILGSFVGAMN